MAHPKAALHEICASSCGQYGSCEVTDPVLGQRFGRPGARRGPSARRDHRRTARTARWHPQDANANVSPGYRDDHLRRHRCRACLLIPASASNEDRPWPSRGDRRAARRGVNIERGGQMREVLSGLVNGLGVVTQPLWRRKVSANRRRLPRVEIAAHEIKLLARQVERRFAEHETQRRRV